MEVCPLRKSDLKTLDFVVDRFFMKLFQTCNMEIIRLSQQMFNFLLPSELIEKRANKFLHVSCCYNLVNIVPYLIHFLLFFLSCVYVCM